MSHRGRSHRHNTRNQTPPQSDDHNNNHTQHNLNDDHNPSNLTRMNNGNQTNTNKNKSHRGKHGHHHHRHGSAMSVPSSRRNVARRTGVHSQQIKSSMEASTWNQTPRRGKIENLKFGAPYNAWNSFFSESSCDEILHELMLALKCQTDLDINVHATGYKIRGRKFAHNMMCEFQIEMFYTSQQHPTYPRHILVEFQRKNGDGFVFQQFVHEIFTELRKTKLIKGTKYPPGDTCHLSPVPLQQPQTVHDDLDNDDQREELKENDTHSTSTAHVQHTTATHSAHASRERIDDSTLKMLIHALFAGDNQMCRSASSYLANRIEDNADLVQQIVRLEPHILTKFSDLLLKGTDPQIVRSIGCTLYHMMQQNEQLRNEALKLNVKTVCKKVYKRWTEPVETRYGSNNKYVVRVIPSMQVAQRMSACIEVLE
mmetsp:Transcript_50981/g.81194  ORF Transcript_50981/g.81194 Transcript_50981/m.81194 type:complete len:427 (+) Transcript_50981:114-1394(+)